MQNKVKDFIKRSDYIVIKVFIGILCIPLVSKIINFIFLFGTLFGSFIRKVLSLTC